jgi:hypothetical protein
LFVDVLASRNPAQRRRLGWMSVLERSFMRHA